MNNKYLEWLSHITVIILSFFFGFLIIMCIMEQTKEPSIEEQIQICKRNGGTPNVHVDELSGDRSLVVECSWEE